MGIENYFNSLKYPSNCIPRDLTCVYDTLIPSEYLTLVMSVYNCFSLLSKEYSFSFVHMFLGCLFKVGFRGSPLPSGCPWILPARLKSLTLIILCILSSSVSSRETCYITRALFKWPCFQYKKLLLLAPLFSLPLPVSILF